MGGTGGAGGELPHGCIGTERGKLCGGRGRSTLFFFLFKQKPLSNHSKSDGKEDFMDFILIDRTILSKLKNPSSVSSQETISARRCISENKERKRDDKLA